MRDQEAIKFIRTVYSCTGQRFLVTISGGKDSTVVEDLVRRSGVPYDTAYSFTYVDPPEVVQFIKRYYPKCKIVRAGKSFWHAVTTQNPPTYRWRWCCTYLKKAPLDKLKYTFRVVGIRKEESTRRKNYPRVNFFEKHKQFHIYPTLEWLDWHVWEYIEERKLPYCSLYDEGFDRLGCIVCPMHGPRVHELYRKRWPAMFRLFEKKVAQWYEKRVKQGRTMAHNSPEEFLVDWYKGKAVWYARTGNDPKSN